MQESNRYENCPLNQVLKNRTAICKIIQTMSPNGLPVVLSTWPRDSVRPGQNNTCVLWCLIMSCNSFQIHRHLTIRQYHDRTKSDLFFLSVRRNMILLKKEKPLTIFFVFYDLCILYRAEKANIKCITAINITMNGNATSTIRITAGSHPPISIIELRAHSELIKMFNL